MDSAFWSALEAIGTVMAVFAAILLAWWEGNKETEEMKERDKVFACCYAKR